MHNCENCNNETDSITEVNAENYPKRFKSEKDGKIFVCKRCLNEWRERGDFLKKIIESDKDRKIILAGPGTGKTYMFREYINKFNKNDSIYIVTFINNLVEDLKRGLEEDIRERDIKINTFHRFCYHLLRLFRKDYAYCPDLTDLIIEDINIFDKKLIDKEKLKKDLNNYKGTIDIKLYFERGKYYKAVGNDNIFFALLKVLNNKGEIDLSKNYKQIIVDEYQDFNFTESSIIKIISKNNKILIAGDDDQALYTFKDSNPKYIRELWKDPKFSKFELPFSHRCTEVIIDSFHYFIKKAKDEEGLLEEREDKKYKCYFPDKYRDSQKYNKIFWYKTSIRKKNYKPIQKILISNIKKYVEENEIERGKLNFLIIYPDNRSTVCQKIKKNVIEELEKLGLSAIDCKKKRKESSLLIQNGYRFLKENKESNLGWRIIIKNDPFEGWENTIKKTEEGSKNIFELLPIDYKNKHLKSLEIFEEEQITEDEKEEGLNLLFTNFHGSKGLSADHVFILFLQDGIFPSNPSSLDNDKVYKFLVALTRSKKSLNLITTYPHSSKFINMLPENNIKIL